MPLTNEFNILFLGETGTGKSTLINSIANYLYIQTLKLEPGRKFHPLIPISSKFSTFDAEERELEVCAGENDGNERTETGRSSTLYCKSYKFNLGNSYFRLIDTAGVGATDGLEEDPKTLSDILNFISRYDSLHAIAVVINSTQNKLTQRFVYCLKILLSNLEKSAVNNLLFILTFSESNSYRPGAVKKLIHQLLVNEFQAFNYQLDKNRLYCVDNRSFQYLVAVEHGVVPRVDDDFHSYNRSWVKSADEIHRLFTFVGSLAPHKVRDTLSINKARQFITEISKFLPEVKINLQENEKMLSAFLECIGVYEDNINNERKRANFQQTSIEIVNLTEPTTFCMSEKCREGVEIGGTMYYYYPIKCCINCRVANIGRWICEAIQVNGYCKMCKCFMTHHDRSYYESRKVKKNLLDIDRIMSARSAKEELELEFEMIRSKQMQLVEINDLIKIALQKFAKFVEVNAIKIPSGKLIEAERVTRAESIKEIGVVSLSGIEKIMEDLKNMPIYGDNIQKIIEATKKGHQASNQKEPTIVNKMNKMVDRFQNLKFKN